MRDLTTRQSEVLAAIIRLKHRNGVHPTIREIGAEIGCKWPRAVTNHLDALVKKGVITRSNQNRSIRIVKEETHGK